MKWSFNIFDFKPTTEEELAENREFLDECERLGINTDTLVDEDIFDENELKALELIAKNKKLPKDLENYLISTRDIRIAKYEDIKNRTVSLDINDINKRFENYMKNANH